MRPSVTRTGCLASATPRDAAKLAVVHAVGALSGRGVRWTPFCEDPLFSRFTRTFPFGADGCGLVGGGTNPCGEGLDLSGSWQQGHSAAYNTPPRI